MQRDVNSASASASMKAAHASQEGSTKVRPVTPDDEDVSCNDVPVERSPSNGKVQLPPVPITPASAVDSLLEQFRISDLVQAMGKHMEWQLEELQMENRQLRASIKVNTVTDIDGRGTEGTELASGAKVVAAPQSKALVSENVISLAPSGIPAPLFLQPDSAPPRNIGDADQSPARRDAFPEQGRDTNALGVDGKEVVAVLGKTEDNEFTEKGGVQTTRMDTKAVRAAVLHDHKTSSMKAPTPLSKTWLRGGRPLIPDMAEMKSQVRSSILHPHDPTQHHHETGWCKALAASPQFECATSCVIMVNALWMSVDADTNGNMLLLDKPVIFQIAEFVFFSYFILEWAVRFGAFRVKLKCIHDQWFVFDSVLVLLMIVDTCLPFMLDSGSSGKTSMLRLVRLVKIGRMARVAKVLRSWPELTILVKGITIACRSVVSTLSLMVVMAYIFALAFRQLTDGTEVGDTYFNSVPFGMKELLINAAMPDAGDFLNALGAENLLFAFLGLLFLGMAALTLMNMLIGVLCEVIGVVSAVEKEGMKVKFVKTQLLEALKEGGITIHEEVVISKHEFLEILSKPGAARAIRSVGVDPVGLIDLTEHIFSGECSAMSKQDVKEGISFVQFMELMLEMGGQNGARVKDIIDLRKVLHGRFETVDHLMSTQNTLLQQLLVSLSRSRQDQQNTILQLAV